MIGILIVNKNIKKINKVINMKKLISICKCLSIFNDKNDNNYVIMSFLGEHLEHLVAELSFLVIFKKFIPKLNFIELSNLSCTGIFVIKDYMKHL